VRNTLLNTFYETPRPEFGGYLNNVRPDDDRRAA
jgi:hypothetical protein